MLTSWVYTTAVAPHFFKFVLVVFHVNNMADKVLGFLGPQTLSSWRSETRRCQKQSDLPEKTQDHDQIYSHSCSVRNRRIFTYIQPVLLHGHELTTSVAAHV